MKVALIAIIACALIATAFAAADCGGGKTCKGPVIEAYTSADCSGDPSAYSQVASDDWEGGKCIKNNPDSSNKFSGSSKGSCGTKLSGRSYATNDCSGPYGTSSVPTNKCFKNEFTSTSHKYQCASASTATFSAALVALLALIALLF